MLLLSLIFLLLVNAVTTRREKFILNRVANVILLYSSIVGYDSLAVTLLGRGISIYGGLFLLQLRLIINYIKQLFKIGFSDYILRGLTFYTTIEVSGRRISDGLTKAKILLNKSWFNNLFYIIKNYVCPSGLLEKK